jgi:hypothetical protein
MTRFRLASLAAVAGLGLMSGCASFGCGDPCHPGLLTRLGLRHRAPECCGCPCPCAAALPVTPDCCAGGFAGGYGGDCCGGGFCGGVPGYAGAGAFPGGGPFIPVSPGAVPEMAPGLPPGAITTVPPPGALPPPAEGPPRLAPVPAPVPPMPPAANGRFADPTPAPANGATARTRGR